MAASPMISYAQNHEDVFLRRRVFADQVTGFYVDIGANDPVDLSVTKHFYDSGWSGINVEPVAYLHDRLRAERPRDVNLQVGISNRPGRLTLYEAVGANGGLSTFSRPLADEHRKQGINFNEYQVEVNTLASVLERNVSGTIDFMSIDVEGHEREVLEGGDWKRWRPRVILIESTIPLTDRCTHQQWEDLLLGEDYAFAAFDGVNRYYVRAEDRQLLPALAAPVNARDEYIVHRYQRQIDEYQRQINGYQRQIDELHAALEASPRIALTLARRLHRLKLRFPRAYAMTRRFYWLTSRRAG
jgi:FkbM family methyltransferase